MTLLDLRLKYLKDTGDQNVPLISTSYEREEYVKWLEERALEGQELFHHCACLAVSHPHLFPQFKVEKQKATNKLDTNEL